MKHLSHGETSKKLFGLQNRSPGPPKSSPEASKTPFRKDVYVKIDQGGGSNSEFERPEANSIELPPGGATAASPFVCKNVGGLPCIEGLHRQDCIAEGTWGNESPHFGFNLPRLCYEFKTLVRNTFLPKEPRKRRTFSQNWSQNPLKSRPGASKIEPGAL